MRCYFAFIVVVLCVLAPPVWAAGTASTDACGGISAYAPKNKQKGSRKVPCGPPKQGTTGSPKLEYSSCKKPIGSSKTANACDLKQCARAEAELECAYDAVKLAGQRLTRLINAAIQDVFGFRPDARTDEQKERYGQLRDLVDALANADKYAKKLTSDPFKTATGNLKKLKDEVAAGPKGDDAAAALLTNVAKIAIAEVDSAVVISNAARILKHFRSILADLKSRSKTYYASNGGGGELRSLLTSEKFKNVVDLFERAKAVQERWDELKKQKCSACSGTQQPLSNVGFEIVSARFGVFSSDTVCDATEHLNIVCNKIRMAAKMCLKKAANKAPTLVICDPKAQDEIGLGDKQYFTDQWPKDANRNICAFKASATEMCGGASQTLLSALGPRMAEVTFKCRNGVAGGTVSRMDGEEVLLDCQPGK